MKKSLHNYIGWVILQIWRHSLPICPHLNVSPPLLSQGQLLFLSMLWSSSQFLSFRTQLAVLTYLSRSTFLTGILYRLSICRKTAADSLHACISVLSYINSITIATSNKTTSTNFVMTTMTTMMMTTTTPISGTTTTTTTTNNNNNNNNNNTLLQKRALYRLVQLAFLSQKRSKVVQKSRRCLTFGLNGCATSWSLSRWFSSSNVSMLRSPNDSSSVPIMSISWETMRYSRQGLTKAGKTQKAAGLLELYTRPHFHELPNDFFPHLTKLQLFSFFSEHGELLPNSWTRIILGNVYEAILLSLKTLHQQQEWQKHSRKKIQSTSRVNLRPTQFTRNSQRIIFTCPAQSCDAFLIATVACSTTLAKKIGTATRQRAQVRDFSSMNAPVVCKRACLNFFGQGSSLAAITIMASSSLVNVCGADKICLVYSWQLGILL